MKKTAKRIPISAAKEVAEKFGYSQVIIHAYDGETGIQHVTTYGKTLADCDHAAFGGNTIKKLLGFPEDTLHEKPARIKRKENKIVYSCEHDGSISRPLVKRKGKWVCGYCNK